MKSLLKLAFLAFIVWSLYCVYKAKKAGASWGNSIKAAIPFGLGNSASVAAPPTGTQ